MTLVVNMLIVLTMIVASYVLVMKDSLVMDRSVQVYIMYIQMYYCYEFARIIPISEDDIL